MATFKLVINDTADGKSYNFEVTGHHAQNLIGKKIGDSIDGLNANLPGYKLEITGGTDKSGFPMRRDFDGGDRRRLLLSEGTGFHPINAPGKRMRKSIRGNMITQDIVQVNVKVAKAGSKPVSEHFAALAGQE